MKCFYYFHIKNRDVTVFGRRHMLSRSAYVHLLNDTTRASVTTSLLLALVDITVHADVAVCLITSLCLWTSLNMSSDDAVFSDVIVFAGAPCLLTSLGLPPQPEEMEKQWLREDSLIAKGQVEVLLLDKDVSASQSAGNHVCSVLSHISTMMNAVERSH